MEWTSPTFDGDQVDDGEKRVVFDLTEDLPDEKWTGVATLLQAIALGGGKPFDNKEQTFLQRVIDETGTTRSLVDLNQDFIKQAYCALPVLPSSERYVEAPATGGGTLVARVKGKDVLAMYYTNDRPTKAQVLVVQKPPPTYETVRYDQPGRSFVELPIERVRALGGDR